MNSSKTRADLFDAQHLAIAHILQHPAAMVWLDMGMGKTASTLTAFDDLRRVGEVRALLVVAPLRVAATVWHAEVQEWQHLQHLRVSRILGTQRQRLAAAAPGADVYVINYENYEWLVQHYVDAYLSRGEYPPVDMAAYDEVTELKNSTAYRSRAARRLLPYLRRRVGLTGTPAPKGYIDLHGQYLALDGGQRLGGTKSYFRNRYFLEDAFTHKWLPLPGSNEAILQQVQDITLNLTNTATLAPLLLPPADIWIDLPPGVRAQYDALERELMVELAGGVEINTPNAGALQSKLLQMASGAVYDSDGTAHRLHAAKLDAVEEVRSYCNSPVLLAYQFRHDSVRLRERFPDAVDFTQSQDIERDIDRWNAGDIELGIGHPKSLGHGLNMQHGGHTVVWFGLTWEADRYHQFNARLARPGQQHPVAVLRILARDTEDELQRSVLSQKTRTEAGIRDAITLYRHRRASALGCPAALSFV